MKFPSQKHIYRYLLVFWLSAAVLLAQYIGIYMHVHHDDHHPGQVAHAVDLGSVANLHLAQFELGEHSHHGDHATHHSFAIDLSFDQLLKKLDPSSLLVFLILFSWLLFLPIRNTLYFKFSNTTTPRFSLYQVFPPLRAPPLI